MVCGKAHLQVVIGLTLTWFVSLVLFSRPPRQARWKCRPGETVEKSMKPERTFPPFPRRLEIRRKTPDSHIPTAPPTVTSQLTKRLHIQYEDKTADFEGVGVSAQSRPRKSKGKAVLS